MTRLGDAWRRFTGTQPAPPLWLVLTAGAVALAAVLSPSVWPRVRYTVTIAHEAGHALAALLTGRQLRGIRLHSDTSGVTLSRGRPRGPGMILTAASGYTAPSLLGLAGAGLLASHHVTAFLWATVLLLIGMLLLIRNAFGVASIVVTGLIVLVGGVLAPPGVESGFAVLVTWFLLLAGVRPVLELRQSRLRARQPQSDADQLAWLTGVPGSAWVGFFGIVTLACLAGGARLLMP